ncbi:unnamed protein product [Mytilus coruscus]|uniref:B box-type domain-containing protein n=1 Tax=Mytilus coruscus TaxID=42192 RepID=A0A6J8A5P2_MYTCO|nr:unnamed protein product [Mytilus coruscus]
MAEGEEKKKEYHIRLLTFLIGPATEALHLFFEIKVLNSLDFFIFLEKHKHILFHELHPSVSCCECDISSIGESQKRGCLNRSQFNLLFEIDDEREFQGHTKKQGQQIKQLCLCGVSAKRTSTVDEMDITLLSAVIKACCPAGSISGNPKWIEEIRDTRNYIAHCPSDKITKSEFDRRFAIAEQSVLNLASVILEVFKEHQTQTIQSLADETRNFAKDSEDMKTEVLRQLHKQKDDIVIEMRNIVFEVKTVIQSELPKATDPNSKIMSQDHDVCYVEWSLATPGNWNVDEIKKTLENISSLIGQWFRIEFVYTGDVVDLCDLDMETKTIVEVEVVLSAEKFETSAEYIVPEQITTSMISCDQCSGQHVCAEAIQYCSECQNNFCQQCITNHNSNAAYMRHSLTDIGKLFVDNICLKHQGGILEYFCVKHDCLCCESCMTKEHSSCQRLVPLEDAAKDVNQSVMFQNVSYALSNITTTLDKAVISQNENIKNLHDDEVTIFNKVASYKTEIIKLLDEFENDIRRNTHLLEKEGKDQSESNRKKLLQIIKPINNISKHLNQAFMYGSQKQMFILIRKCALDVSVFELKLQEIVSTLGTKRILFQPSDNIHDMVRSLGSTILHSLPYEADYKTPKIQQVQIPLLTPQMTMNFTLSRKIEIKRYNVCLSSMGMTEDNRLLLCNNNSPCLLVYSDLGEYLQDCRLPDIPWDIAVIPGEDKAVVSLLDQCFVQFIDIKTMIAGSLIAVPDVCYGVTFVNGKICVGGYGRYIHILDKQGKHITKVKLPDAGNIYYLHPGPLDSIYFTHFTDHAVSCVTLEGELRFTYTSKNLKRPQAVITDTKGQLYLACKDSNNIQRLTPKGEFIDIILIEKNNVEYPVGLVFSNNYRKLFVLNQSKDTYILVFACS